LLQTVVALCLSLPASATAQQPGFQDALLDHLAGNWVLRGTIAGAETTHDIVSEWVLGHYYLRLHEVSREKGAGGEPAYEAIVFIGWDEPSNQYVCLWLDSTGGSGLTAQAFGHAKKRGDDLAFVFKPDDGSIIYTTFAYSRDGDTWQWLIDVERSGKRTRFATVTLTRQEFDGE
jgi:hypothetical protein